MRALRNFQETRGDSRRDAQRLFITLRAGNSSPLAIHFSLDGRDSIDQSNLHPPVWWRMKDRVYRAACIKYSRRLLLFSQRRVVFLSLTRRIAELTFVRSIVPQDATYTVCRIPLAPPRVPYNNAIDHLRLLITSAYRRL